MATGDKNDSKIIFRELLTRFETSTLDSCEQEQTRKPIETVSTSGKNVSGQDSPASESTPNFLDLPVEIVWTKILAYLDYKDLKSLRATCVEMNTNIVPFGSNFIAKSCFFYNDEDDESRDFPLKDLKDRDWILQINNHFRLACLQEVKKENWLPFFQDKFTLLQRVKVLELKAILIHWTNVFDLLSCFQNIEEFIISAQPVYDEILVKLIDHFLRGLKEGLLLDQTEEWESRGADPWLELANLKKVTIDLPSLHLVTTVMRIFEFRCSNLEDLNITLHSDCICETCIDVPADITCRIDAETLMLKNKGTLRKFDLKILPRIAPGAGAKEFSKSSIVCTILAEIFQLRGFKLEEFVLNVPLYFGDPDVGANEPRKFLMDQIFAFLEDQKESLKIVRFEAFGLYPGLEDELKKIISPKLKLHLDAFTTDTTSKPEWDFLADKMGSLTVKWLGVSKPFGDFLQVGEGGDETSVAAFLSSDADAKAGRPIAMPNVKSYIFWNSLLLFKDFDLHFVMDKFPNLTTLAVANYAKVLSYSCSSVGPQLKAGLQFNFEIDDEMFQSILEKLPKLEYLHLDCAMAKLTDFGITGISHEALARMKLNNRYVLDSGDKTGFSLPRGLKTLKLYGVGHLVTNATAWLAFRSMSSLAELTLVAPKMSKTAQRYIRSCFGRKPGFALEIVKDAKIPDPNDIMCCTYNLSGDEKLERLVNFTYTSITR